MTAAGGRDHWGGKTAYFPIIRFAGPLGKSVEFQSSTGTQFEHYKTGAAVPVLFNPEDPAEAVIDQFLMRRGPELWMTIAGVVLLLGSVVSALE